MEARGVARPMALQKVQDHGAGEDAGVHGPDEMLESHHRATLWVPWTVLLLGVWTALAPFSFGYLNDDLWAVPSGGRGAWFAGSETFDSLRAGLMTWSDVLSGLALVALGWRALRSDRPVARWGACAVGLWLLFAPVAFWAPTASAFVNDSLVGLLVISLTILIPGMPNMIRYMHMGPPTPPGWSYNPSTWAQRSILIGLGFTGLVVSRYLAMYQLGYIDQVWDPFFGFASGTQLVLDSEMSHAWPLSDAGVGTFLYSIEFLMGFMGSESRWRTMPWMVTMFGIIVIPLGLAHIVLVMSQPVVVHAFSTFALLAALVMLPMITLTVDEVVAMGQHVRDAVRRGDRDGSAWKVFWLGGRAEGSTADDRTPSIADAHNQPGPLIRASLWGATAPWSLVAVTALGVWLLTAPSALGVDITSGAADVAHIGGAFVVVAAVVAMAEVVRLLRMLCVPAGIAIAALVLVTDAGAAYTAAVLATGLAISVLSVARGRILETYGSWRLLTR